MRLTMPLAILSAAMTLLLRVASAAPAAPLAVGADAIAVPKDVAYPGTLSLSVDLTDVGQRIFRVQETIPVHAGPMVLLYPKWIPGEHGPTGTLDALVGVKITAAGQPVPWRRDLQEMYALHVTVPAGVEHLEVQFQVLSPFAGGNFGGSCSVTDHLVDLEWNQVLFYPAGHFAHNVMFLPSVRLPPGWKLATALQVDAPSGDSVQFRAVSLETLVDSPLIGGKYFRRIPISAEGVPPVYLNVVADRAENLAATDAQIQQQMAVVREAYAMFGSRHYQHYDFLLTLSDSTAHFGLEHHQSSDDRVAADYFTDNDHYLASGYLLTHEYVHSWNGKFRRPAGLATPNYEIPMLGDLLWVYEGLTNYLGEVLAPRAGIWSAAQYREYLAERASSMNHVPGREWRSLQDTADEAQVLYNLSENWQSWRRTTDFYDEGSLLWLDVDTKLRELSHDRKTLDDFTHAFLGMQDGAVGVLPYDANEVTATLNRIQNFDWAGFLRARLSSNAVEAPLDGIRRGGWKLIYNEQPNSMLESREKARKITELTDSIGLEIDEDDKPGTVIDALWQGPAFEAGAAPGMRIVAVNGDRYSAEVLKDAISSSRGGSKPIELLMQNQDVFSTLKVDYHDGLKYPHLERIEGTPDRLTAILAPHH